MQAFGQAAKSMKSQAGRGCKSFKSVASKFQPPTHPAIIITSAFTAPYIQKLKKKLQDNYIPYGMQTSKKKVNRPPNLPADKTFVIADDSNGPPILQGQFIGLKMCRVDYPKKNNLDDVIKQFDKYIGLGKQIIDKNSDYQEYSYQDRQQQEHSVNGMNLLNAPKNQLTNKVNQYTGKVDDVVQIAQKAGDFKDFLQIKPSNRKITQNKSIKLKGVQKYEENIQKTRTFIDKRALFILLTQKQSAKYAEYAQKFYNSSNKRIILIKSLEQYYKLCYQQNQGENCLLLSPSVASKELYKFRNLKDVYIYGDDPKFCAQLVRGNIKKSATQPEELDRMLQDQGFKKDDQKQFIQPLRWLGSKTNGEDIKKQQPQQQQQKPSLFDRITGFFKSKPKQDKEKSQDKQKRKSKQQSLKDPRSKKNIQLKNKQNPKQQKLKNIEKIWSNSSSQPESSSKSESEKQMKKPKNKKQSLKVKKKQSHKQIDLKKPQKQKQNQKLALKKPKNDKKQTYSVPFNQNLNVKPKGINQRKKSVTICSSREGDLISLNKLVNQMEKLQQPNGQNTNLKQQFILTSNQNQNAIPRRKVKIKSYSTTKRQEPVQQPENFLFVKNASPQQKLQIESNKSSQIDQTSYYNIHKDLPSAFKGKSYSNRQFTQAYKVAYNQPSKKNSIKQQQQQQMPGIFVFKAPPENENMSLNINEKNETKRLSNIQQQQDDNNYIFATPQKSKKDQRQENLRQKKVSMQFRVYNQPNKQQNKDLSNRQPEKKFKMNQNLAPQFYLQNPSKPQINDYQIPRKNQIKRNTSQKMKVKKPVSSSDSQQKYLYQPNVVDQPFDQLCFIPKDTRFYPDQKHKAKLEQKKKLNTIQGQTLKSSEFAPNVSPNKLNANMHNPSKNSMSNRQYPNNKQNLHQNSLNQNPNYPYNPMKSTGFYDGAPNQTPRAKSFQPNRNLYAPNHSPLKNEFDQQNLTINAPNLTEYQNLNKKFSSSSPLQNYLKTPSQSIYFKSHPTNQVLNKGPSYYSYRASRDKPSFDYGNHAFLKQQSDQLNIKNIPIGANQILTTPNSEINPKLGNGNFSRSLPFDLNKYTRTYQNGVTIYRPKLISTFHGTPNRIPVQAYKNPPFTVSIDKKQPQNVKFSDLLKKVKGNSTNQYFVNRQKIPSAQLKSPPSYSHHSNTARKYPIDYSDNHQQSSSQLDNILKTSQYTCKCKVLQKSKKKIFPLEKQNKSPVCNCQKLQERLTKTRQVFQSFDSNAEFNDNKKLKKHISAPKVFTNRQKDFLSSILDREIFGAPNNFTHNIKKNFTSLYLINSHINKQFTKQIFQITDQTDTVQTFSHPDKLLQIVTKANHIFDFVIVFLNSENDQMDKQIAENYSKIQNLYFVIHRPNAKQSNVKNKLITLKALPQILQILKQIRSKGTSQINAKQIGYVYFKDFNKSIRALTKILKANYPNIQVRKYFSVEDLPTKLPSLPNQLTVILLDEVGFNQIYKYLSEQNKQNSSILKICVPKSAQAMQICQKLPGAQRIIWLTDKQLQDQNFILKRIQRRIK